MLSPEERRLIISILALLLLGAVIDGCRSRVVMQDAGKTVLPSVPATKPEAHRQ